MNNIQTEKKKGVRKRESDQKNMQRENGSAPKFELYMGIVSDTQHGIYSGIRLSVLLCPAGSPSFGIQSITPVHTDGELKYTFVFNRERRMETDERMSAGT